MSQPHRAVALPRVPPLRTALVGMGETGLTDAVVDAASWGDGEAGLSASLELRNRVRTVSHSPSNTAGGQC